MIDVENQVYTAVKTVLTSTFSTVWMTGEYVSVPPKFPAVMLIEMSNVPVRTTQSSSEQENHASIMYELDVYSNKATGKKTQAKQIASTVDQVMQSLGFCRTFLNPIPNLNDSTVYRIKGRYEAIVGKDETIYRRR